MRIALLLCAIVAWTTLALCSEKHGKTTVSGTVVLADDSSRVPGATVLFQSSDGHDFRATTNQVGEYEVALDAMKEYTVTVAGRQLCQVHRPPFLAKSGAALELNFASTICGFIDRVVVVPRNIAHNDNRFYYLPYYPSDDKGYPYWFFEEAISMAADKERWAVVAFGSRTDKGQISYGPFRIRAHTSGGPIFLPVTISFDTYTIRADGAVLDRKANTIKAEGNVNIENGTASSARSESCIMVPLSIEQPSPQACNARH